MTTGGKVALVLGILFLVGLVTVIAVAGFGYYFWREHGQQIVDGSRRAMEEGRDFGRGVDNQRCLDEGITRHKNANGLAELIVVNLFTRTCLEASRPTAGFCDNVPRAIEFVNSARWQREQCERHSLSQERACGQLFQQVQQFCEQRNQRPQNSNTP